MDPRILLSDVCKREHLLSWQCISYPTLRASSLYCWSRRVQPCISLMVSFAQCADSLRLLFTRILLSVSANKLQGRKVWLPFMLDSILRISLPPTPTRSRAPLTYKFPAQEMLKTVLDACAL